MSKKSSIDHRPIVISVHSAFSKKEGAELKEIVGTLCRVARQKDKELNELTRRFRQLVGFKELNVSFGEQFCDSEAEYNPKEWIAYATKTRMRWAMEEVGLEKEAPEPEAELRCVVHPPKNAPAKTGLE